MAEHVEPSMKYLQKFTSPLWDLIDLENYKPVSIIEAQRAGFDVVIIDMQHRAYGLMADNGQTANTTFFVLRHQSAYRQPQIADIGRVRQYDVRLQVSVDSEAIYMAVPAKQIRPGEWEAILQIMATLAAELKETPATGQQHVKGRVSYRPVGAGYAVYLFWTIVSLIVAVTMLGFGLGGLFGLTKLAETWRESNKLSGEMLLASVFFFFGALHSYTKAKKRR